MSEELNLVRDLAVILISAGVFTIISKALKQPLVIGYIIAGFLIGPNFHFFFNVTSAESIEQWSEIGLIFMMFGLGLEFSFKKLLKVGAGALVTAGTKAAGVFILGYVSAKAMGWTDMESIFLGGLLGMSSTAVVIKSYDDMGLKKKPFAGLVFGTLVVEDLIAIILMVLLSTMAVSNKFEGKEMVLNLAKLVFFLILWFLVGIYLIPSILKQTRKYLNDEILLLVSAGLCFGMVTLASAVGFSSALGAFVMGSILAETVESEHIEKLTHPIKDLFGAIFFISVGMMIAPSAILEHWGVILFLVFFVIVTHIIFSAVGAILTGSGLETGVRTGFSLAQLGEFGFILAGLGVSLGVMRDFIYPVIISVSVITTFTTPYMIKFGEPVHRFLAAKLPDKLLARIDTPAKKKKSAAESSVWKQLLTSYFTRILLYGVIILAIFIASKLYLVPLTAKMFPSWSGTLRDSFNAGVTIFVMIPFLYGLGVNRGSMSEQIRVLQKDSQNRLPLLGLFIARIFLVTAIITGVISSYVELAGWSILLILVAAATVIIFSRRYIKHFTALEGRFLQNLNEKETLQRKKAPVATTIGETLSEYDVRIETLELSPDSLLAGKTLRQADLRKNSGANVVKIQRGSHSFVIPGVDTVLFPGDRIIAVGSAQQLEDLKTFLKASEATGEKEKDFNVVRTDLGEESYLTGKQLGSLDMRAFHCMIISVIRGEEVFTNPRPDFVFSPGDHVWIAGETDSLHWLA
ncbi:MAG: cation:proton antiporter [Bacteroidales bacterium]|nr:cation:proton antiporter [Bacteroidales bacterium]